MVQQEMENIILTTTNSKEWKFCNIHTRLTAVTLRYMIVGTKWEDNKKDKTYLDQESTQESTQEMILDEIRKHPFTTRKQLSKLIGITPDGIKKQLDKLKKAKVIKHVGPTKGGHWEIIK